MPLDLSLSCLMPAFLVGILALLLLAVSRSRATRGSRENRRLRDGNVRLQCLLDAATDAILIVERGQIVDGNRGAVAMFGLSQAELRHAGINDLLLPHHWATAVQSLAAGSGEPQEAVGRRGDQEFPLEYRALRASLGRRAVEVVVVSDISERKRAEAELRDSEERFRSIADSAVDAIVSADAAGNVIFWNSGARAMFGYESDEVMGRPLGDLMPERYRTAHQAGLSRVAAGGARHLDGRAVEVEGLRKDGSEFPLELTVSTWDKGGRVFFGGILRDISERRRAEMELRNSEERFYSITDSAVDAIVSRRGDLRADKLSRAVCSRSRIRLGSLPRAGPGGCPGRAFRSIPA
jgi:PAS domain S-box-containing protein